MVEGREEAKNKTSSTTAAILLLSPHPQKCRPGDGQIHSCFSCSAAPVQKLVQCRRAHVRVSAGYKEQYAGCAEAFKL